MIFKQYLEIAEGTKTQTRRPVKPGESLHPNGMTGLRSIDEQAPWVWTTKRRLKWQVGRSYAVQAARGGKALFRIKLTGIRQESLQDISGEDAMAEGFAGPGVYEVSLRAINAGGVEAQRNESAIAAFRAVWEELYPHGAFQWCKNPAVWVLDFELTHN